MPVAMDTGQAPGPSSAGHKDKCLQVLLQELCQLQAKYAPLQAPPGPQPHAQCPHRGLSGWACAKMPGQEMEEGRKAWK